MKRINVMVSDEAKEIILKFKDEKGIRTLDEAVDTYILEHEKLKEENSINSRGSARISCGTNLRIE